MIILGRRIGGGFKKARICEFYELHPLSAIVSIAGSSGNS